MKECPISHTVYSYPLLRTNVYVHELKQKKIKKRGKKNDREADWETERVGDKRE